MKIIQRILSAYLSSARQRMLSGVIHQEETIQLWQGEFFVRIMNLILPFAVIALIPSQVLSMREGLYFLFAFNSMAFVAVLFIFLAKRVSVNLRKAILLITLYSLGIVLLYSLGWNGPGLAYLLGFSAFATLIASKRVGYSTLILNIIVLCIFYLITKLEVERGLPIVDIKPGAIATIGINLILVNLVLVASIASLMDVLGKKLEAERAAKNLLKQEMEMHQQARQRAEESDRLKTSFLANLSHEIRTPLNSIIGFTQRLWIETLPKEKKEQYLRIIESSGNRLLTTINDLIDIARIETGQVSVSMESIDVLEMLRGIHAQFQPEANDKGLELDLILPSDSTNEFVITTDKEKIYSIVTNLLKNALKYTNTGRVQLGLDTVTDTLKIYVNDTGIGIPKDMHDRVFERFIQTEEAISSPYEGSGLGLAISKAYAEMLGGRICLKSEVGTGSQFGFILPYTHRV